MKTKRIIQVGNIYGGSQKFSNRTAGRLYSIDGIAPTIRTPSGGGTTPIIVIEDERGLRNRKE